MTHLIGKTLVICAENNRKCTTCGKDTETRPYGKDDARVCHDCAMATPETRATAKAAFNKLPKGKRHG